MSNRGGGGHCAGDRGSVPDLLPRLACACSARVHAGCALLAGALLATLALVAAVAGPSMVPPALADAGPCPNAAFRTGFSAHLADCRAYERVSPAGKSGADAILMTSLFPARASEQGGSIAYLTAGSFAGSAGGEMPSAYLGSRGEDGWRTRSLAPPTLGATPPVLASLGYDFSADLSRFVLKVPLQNLTPGVTPPAPAGVYNLYLSHPDGSWSLLTSAPPLVSPPANCSECFKKTDLSAFAGASSDFSHVIFEANEGLTPGAPPAPLESLYESAGGQIRPVGVLPDGKIAAGGSEPGAGINVLYTAVADTASQDVNHAISPDGSHILFQAAADGGAPDPAQSGLTELYDRIGASSTIEISVPAQGATPASSTPEPARFWAASTGGSLVFFTSSAELTTRSNTGSGNAGEDLYQYNLDTRTLTDLTLDANPTDASSGAGVLGVAGASEDGSYVYFVARGQLQAGRGVDGRPNLYLYHAGEVSFIATLSEGDQHDWTSTPSESQAYVTPDGRHLAFMSLGSPTGYENHDRNTGEADSEVYEYSAEGGSLACASCDPGQARPAGSAFIGARLHEWTGTPFYQPRALSDDGSRLFFSSPDPLVPGAASSHVNVFEYEEGAVHLISSGAGSTDDLFLDASPSGNDVFFATRQELVAGDEDELIDVYDARAGGGFSAPTPPAACAGSVCQGPPETLPLLSSAPASTFTGLAGDPAPAATPPAQARRPRARGKPRKTKKAKAGKPAHRKHHRGTRGKRGGRGRKSRAGGKTPAEPKAWGS